MGTRIISNGAAAAFYDSVNMQAFGPVLFEVNGIHEHGTPEEAAQAFLAWWRQRSMSDPREVPFLFNEAADVWMRGEAP